jgi:uncharacterized sulfatase
MKLYNLFSTFIITGLILLSLFACNLTEEIQKENKPLNIIYIMADDHAYQAVSAYGSEISKLAPTPNIDRIGQQGCSNGRCLLY